MQELEAGGQNSSVQNQTLNARTLRYLPRLARLPPDSFHFDRRACSWKLSTFHNRILRGWMSFKRTELQQRIF